MKKSYDDPTNDGCFRVSLKGKYTPKFTPQDFLGKGKLFLNDKEIKEMKPFVNEEESKAFAKMMMDFQLKELSKNVSSITRKKIEDLITPTKRDMYIPSRIPQEALNYLKKQTQKDHEESEKDIKNQFFDEANEISPEAWKSLKENRTLPSKLHLSVNPKGDRLSEFIHELPERECCKVNRITFHHFKYCPMCGKLLNRRELGND